MTDQLLHYTEYRTVDKSEWQRGPWDQEPDKAQWIDAATGLDCLIVRNRGGALCGYVGVNDSHPWHGKSYNDVDVDAHGGLTFSEGCSDASVMAFDRWRQRLQSARVEAVKHPEGDSARFVRDTGHLENDYEGWLKWHESVAICHLPINGRPDHVWWFGFDCAHSGDVSPGHDSILKRLNLPSFGRYGADDTYKDWRYVTREVQALAEQIAKAQP